MIFRNSTVVAAWAVAFLTVSPAVVSFQLRPPSASLRLPGNQAVAGTPPGGFSNVLGSPYSATSSSKSPSSTTSSWQLRMGIMEDFISNTDSSQREADNKKYLDTLQKRVQAINALEDDIEELGDEELQAKTMEFRERLKAGEDINGPLLEEMFAVVREAAWCVVAITTILAIRLL